MNAIPLTADKMRQAIDGLAAQADPSISSAFTQAMRAFFTAKDDRDTVLMLSHLEEALAAFADAVNDAVGKRLGWPQRAREHCRQIHALLVDVPVENVDDLGKEIESRLDNLTKMLVDLRDGPVQLLTERGHEIANAAQLERDVAELQIVKKSVLENWPWSTQDLPPVDWAMADASMAALARGEKGEPIEELIHRLRGNL